VGHLERMEHMRDACKTLTKRELEIWPWLIFKEICSEDVNCIQLEGCCEPLGYIIYYY
jgi:hypothetical protein